MELEIHYYDRSKNEKIILKIPSDCIDVLIPPQEGQPALSVTVNTDAVQVWRHKRLMMQTYIDLIAEAERDD